MLKKICFVNHPKPFVLIDNFLLLGFLFLHFESFKSKRSYYNMGIILANNPCKFKIESEHFRIKYSDYETYLLL